MNTERISLERVGLGRVAFYSFLTAITLLLVDWLFRLLFSAGVYASMIAAVALDHWWPLLVMPGLVVAASAVVFAVFVSGNRCRRPGKGVW